MKTPDKIYIDNKTLTRIEGFIPEGYPATEYICKDALLEWAENWGKYKLRTDDGFLYAMELLINKLNSIK